MSSTAVQSGSFPVVSVCSENRATGYGKTAEEQSCTEWEHDDGLLRRLRCVSCPFALADAVVTPRDANRAPASARVEHDQQVRDGGEGGRREGGQTANASSTTPRESGASSIPVRTGRNDGRPSLELVERRVQSGADVAHERPLDVEAEDLDGRPAHSLGLRAGAVDAESPLLFLGRPERRHQRRGLP